MTLHQDSEASASRGTPPPRKARNRLVNIDNGGTLTDICVIDADRVYRAKTLTTPHDLSQCLFDGLRKASLAVFGREDLQALLLSTAAIRYSTTQGTNALVERKGPRLGLIVGGTLDAAAVTAAGAAGDLLDAVVGARIVRLDAGLEGQALQSAAVQAVADLTAAGANRLVVSFGGPRRREQEAQVKRQLLRTFPPHLLGALPVLYASELVDDADDPRRTWTAIFNAFLHPAMERFLYSAEHKLRDARALSPLLVFRNDGHAGRVAKTIAVQTYGSGPRGGMQGASELARHYGLARLLSMDIGGTTTDIGLVDAGGIRLQRRGRIESVETSFALCDLVSAGVGGSSIIEARAGGIAVGPQSVGSAPGPACFGLGGTQATITDALVLAGLLEPSAFFGGDLRLDPARAGQAVREHVGGPLGIDDDAAVAAMEQAWVTKVADSLRGYTEVGADTTLAAFGGAGPLLACRIAETIGARQVMVPGLAAVFSAYGIGFSDVGHGFSQQLAAADDAALDAAMQALRGQAARAMYGEGASLDECRLEWSIEESAQGRVLRTHALAGGHMPPEVARDAVLTLQLLAVKPVAHASMRGAFGAAAQEATSRGTREVLLGGRRRALPLYRVEDQPAGVAVRAQGPAVLEEAYFTARIDDGWSIEINAAGDILLSRGAEAHS